MGRGRVNTHPIFSHLWVQTQALPLDKEVEEVCAVKLSQSQVWPG
jgi:hypothetical protein